MTTGLNNEIKAEIKMFFETKKDVLRNQGEWRHNIPESLGHI